MKTLMVTVYDSAAKVYTTPFFVRTPMEAIRSFGDAVGDSKSPFCQHPEHYTLFAIGEYDDSTGSGVFNPAAEKLISALECVSERPK